MRRGAWKREGGRLLSRRSPLAPETYFIDALETLTHNGGGLHRSILNLAMQKYECTELLGEGAYGKVMKATNREDGDVVAIKQIKRAFHSWEECMRLRELQALRKLKHENIVRLKELIRDSAQLFFVFEFIPTNLASLTSERRRAGTPFSTKEVRDISRQLFAGMAYMHKHNYFHRDIKPDNLLVDPGEWGSECW
jgi:protein kinase